jgi:ketosteroid isomerase-like protein
MCDVALVNAARFSRADLMPPNPGGSARRPRARLAPLPYALELAKAMNDFRSIGVLAKGDGSDIGRKAYWVVRELGLPAIVKACVSCRSARHQPTGKFRVNANGKLLDVWMLIRCDLCGRTSKVSVHERIYVQALRSERLATEWDGFTVHAGEFHDAGDVVVVEGRYTGTYKETGKRLDAQVCHVWKIRDGKVASFQQYVDTAQLQDVEGTR